MAPSRHPKTALPEMPVEVVKGWMPNRVSSLSVEPHNALQKCNVNMDTHVRRYTHCIVGNFRMALNFVFFI